MRHRASTTINETCSATHLKVGKIRDIKYDCFILLTNITSYTSALVKSPLYREKCAFQQVCNHFLYSTLCFPSLVTEARSLGKRTPKSFCYIAATNQEYTPCLTAPIIGFMVDLLRKEAKAFMIIINNVSKEKTNNGEQVGQAVSNKTVQIEHL